jgi:hypothetical protein
VVLVFPTAKNFVVGPQPSSGVARRWRQGSHAGDAAHLGCRTRKPEMRKITFIDECAFFVDAFEFSGNAAPFLCTHSAVNPPKGVVFVSGPAAQCSVLLKFSGLAAQVGPLTPVALIIFITSARYLGSSRQTLSFGSPLGLFGEDGGPPGIAVRPKHFFDLSALRLQR